MAFNRGNDKWVGWKCCTSGHQLFLYTLNQVADSYLQLGNRDNKMRSKEYSDMWDTALFAVIIFHDLIALHKFYGNQQIEIDEV